MASQTPTPRPTRREGDVLSNSPRILSRIFESVEERVIVTDAHGRIDRPEGRPSRFVCRIRFIRRAEK
jgi:hypothetical protein